LEELAMANELATTHATFSKATLVSLEIDPPGGVKKILGEVIEIGDLSQDRERIDVTYFSDLTSDPDWLARKYILGLYDESEITFSLNYPHTLAPGSETTWTFNELFNHHVTGAIGEWEIYYPDDSWFRFDGILAQIVNRISLDAQIIFDCVVRVVSSVQYLPGPAAQERKKLLVGANKDK
jgi:hypothetical protein